MRISWGRESFSSTLLYLVTLRSVLPLRPVLEYFFTAIMLPTKPLNHERAKESLQLPSVLKQHLRLLKIICVIMPTGRATMLCDN